MLSSVSLYNGTVSVNEFLKEKEKETFLKEYTQFLETDDFASVLQALEKAKVGIPEDLIKKITLSFRSFLEENIDSSDAAQLLIYRNLAEALTSLEPHCQSASNGCNEEELPLHQIEKLIGKRMVVTACTELELDEAKKFLEKRVESNRDLEAILLEVCKKYHTEKNSLKSQEVIKILTNIGIIGLAGKHISSSQAQRQIFDMCCRKSLEIQELFISERSSEAEIKDAERLSLDVVEKCKNIKDPFLKEQISRVLGLALRIPM